MSLLKNGNVIGGISKALLSKIGFSDLNTKSQNLCDAINELADMIYPVGSIYMSVNNVNPSTLFGGTWEAWGSGQVPVGVNTNDTDFNTVEKTGGSKTQSYTPAGTNSKPTFTGTKATLSHTGGAVSNHTLTTSEIPSHSHTENDQAWANLQPTTTTGNHMAKRYAKGSGDVWMTTRTKGGGMRAAMSTANTGGGGAHNHGFTQPTAHTYTPAGTNSAPTFTGTQATINHLQPYITCYMWKRVA